MVCTPNSRSVFIISQALLPRNIHVHFGGERIIWCFQQLVLHIQYPRMAASGVEKLGVERNPRGGAMGSWNKGLRRRRRRRGREGGRKEEEERRRGKGGLEEGGRRGFGLIC